MKNEENKEDKQKKLNEKLFKAIRTGYLPGVKEAVEAGADVNAGIINVKNQESETPLFLACAKFGNDDIIEYLLEHDADPNIKDKKGVSILHRSIEQKKISVIEILLKYNADMNIEDSEDLTPYNYAVNNFVFLTAGSYCRAYSISDLLVLNGYVPTDKDFKINFKKIGPFRAQRLKKRACELLKLNQEERLEEMKRVKLNACLHSQFSNAFTGSLSNIKKEIKRIVSEGGDINSIDDYSGEPLIIKAACLESFASSCETTKFLIETGANINIQDDVGNTVLHHLRTCANLYGGSLSPERYDLFIRAGADMYIENNFGFTPFTDAVLNNNFYIAELLILSGYMPTENDYKNLYRDSLYKDVTDKFYKMASLTKESKEYLYSIKIKERNLLVSVLNKDMDTINSLLNEKVDINSLTHKNTSLLNEAIKGKQNEDVVEFLLENGAKTDIKDKYGNTVLHAAAGMTGVKRKIKMLLKYGADMYVLNNNNETPFCTALISRNYDTADIFVSNGYIPTEKDFAKLNHLSDVQKKSLMKEYMELAQKIKVTAMQKEAESSYDCGEIIDI